MTLLVRGNPVVPSTPGTPSCAVAVVDSTTLRVTPSGTAAAGWKSWEVQTSDASSSGPWTTLETDRSTISFPLDVPDLEPATQYWFRVRGTDNLGNVSAYSSAGTATTSGAAWVTQNPSYLPAVPGLAGYGMDSAFGSGRHLSTPETSVLYVDDLATGSSGSYDSGTRTGYGTLEYCLAYNGPRVVIPITSGVVQSSPPDEFDVRPDRLIFAGQCAPAPGLYLRGTKITFTGSHQLVMHLRAYMGDDSSGLAANERDGSYVGYFTTPRRTAQVLINCEIGWSIDELLDLSQAQDNVSLIQCALIEPLANSTHPDGEHNFGPIVGGVTGERASYFSTQRCLVAHAWYRGPLSRARYHAQANTLHYNWGNNANTSGYAISFEGHGDGVNTQIGNVVNCWFMKGPNQTSNTVIQVGDPGAPALLSGSRLAVIGNSTHGMSFASQSAMVTQQSGTPASYVQSSIQSTAWPNGWGASAEYIRPGSISSDDEWLEVIDLFRRTVGAQPGIRTIGRVGTICDQMTNKVDGSGSTGGVVDSVTEAGGWPTVSVNTIDPTSPGSDWGGEPVPTVSGGRDVVQSSGYTLLEEWLHRRHAEVIG